MRLSRDSFISHPDFFYDLPILILCPFLYLFSCPLLIGVLTSFPLYIINNFFPSVVFKLFKAFFRKICSIPVRKYILLYFLIILANFTFKNLFNWNSFLWMVWRILFNLLIEERVKWGSCWLPHRKALNSLVTVSYYPQPL